MKTNINVSAEQLAQIVPCVIYVRVSTEEQKEGFSLSAQLELLVDYAKKQGFKIVRVFEESQSAKDSGRAQFNKMLKYLQSHPSVNTILVEKTDRLYRNFKDYAIIDDNKFNIHLVKENEVLSPNSTSHQKLVHGLKVLLAKNFVDNLREETRKGRLKKAQEGYIVGIAPYGYRKINKNEAVVVPEEAAYVKRCFELYAQGYSLQQVCGKMFADGYRYKEQNHLLVRNHLHHILKNKLYTGVICFEDEEFEGRHEAIITPELFEKVNALMKREREYTHDYIFAGLIHCARCGCAITAELRKGKYIYYHCTGARDKGMCRQKHILVHEKTLYSQFEKAISRITVPPERVENLRTKMMRRMRHIAFIDVDKRKELTEQRNRLLSKLETMYVDKLNGELPSELYVKKKAEFDAEIAKIDEKLQGATADTSVTDYEAINQMFENLNNLPVLFKNGGFQAQHNIAELVFSHVTLKGRILQFTYAPPFNYFVHMNRVDSGAML